MVESIFWVLFVLLAVMFFVIVYLAKNKVRKEDESSDTGDTPGSFHQEFAFTSETQETEEQAFSGSGGTFGGGGSSASFDSSQTEHSSDSSDSGSNGSNGSSGSD